MTQSPKVRRWAKRALAALLVTGALATPFIASYDHATTGQIAQMRQSRPITLAMKPNQTCPGSPFIC